VKGKQRTCDMAKLCRSKGLAVSPIQSTTVEVLGKVVMWDKQEESRAMMLEERWIEELAGRLMA
jgi:hypothetical protein